MTASCTGGACHDDSSPAQGLDLTNVSTVVDTASLCADLRPRIDGAQRAPHNSHIIQKLTDLNACGGAQMPQNDPPLTWAEVNLITRWICAGAPP